VRYRVAVNEVVTLELKVSVRAVKQNPSYKPGFFEKLFG
jgi:hypothetical protein